MSDELSNLAIVEELGAHLDAAFRRRERGRLRRPATRVAALAAAAAIGAGAVLATQLGDGGLTTARADAAQVLRAAARVVAARPVTAIPRDAYYYIRIRTRVLLPIAREGDGPLPRSALSGPLELVTIDTRRTWNQGRGGAIATRVVRVRFPTAAARRRWISLGRPNVSRDLVASPGWIDIPPSSVVAVGASGKVTLRRLLSLPASTSRVYRVLFAGLGAQAAIDLLQDANFFPLRSELQAALYRALALVPGIRNAGRAGVLDGRTGIALGARDPRAGVEDEVVIDPVSGQVLGFRTVSIARGNGLPPGTVRTRSAVVERRITHTAHPH